MGQSGRSLNPWKAGWLAHSVVFLWLVLAAFTAAKIGIHNLLDVALFCTPTALGAFWINTALHKNRRRG